MKTEYITEYNSFIINFHIFEQTLFTLYDTQKVFFSTSENENPELYKSGGRSAMLQIFPRGRSAMKGGRYAMFQTFPLGGRSAMLKIFRGKVCNVADLPGEGLRCCRPSGGKVCKGEGLQYNTGT